MVLYEQNTCLYLCVYVSWMSLISRDPQSQDGGELTLGGTNPAHYQPPFQYAPLSNTTWWEIKIDE